MDEKILQLWKKNVEFLMDKTKAAIEELKKTGTMGDGVGVTAAEKNQAYTLGYQLFQQKKYDKALTIFEALFMLDPLNPDYGKCIAATLQMQKNFPEAGMRYLMTYFFNPEDLDLALQAGRCIMEMGQPQNAYLILHGIVEAKRYPINDANKKHLAVIKTLMDASKNIPNKPQEPEKKAELKSE